MCRSRSIGRSSLPWHCCAQRFSGCAICSCGGPANDGRGYNDTGSGRGGARGGGSARCAGPAAGLLSFAPLKLQLCDDDGTIPDMEGEASAREMLIEITKGRVTGIKFAHCNRTRVLVHLTEGCEIIITCRSSRGGGTASSSGSRSLSPQPVKTWAEVTRDSAAMDDIKEILADARHRPGTHRQKSVERYWGCVLLLTFEALQLRNAELRSFQKRSARSAADAGTFSNKAAYSTVRERPSPDWSRPTARPMNKALSNPAPRHIKAKASKSGPPVIRSITSNSTSASSEKATKKVVRDGSPSRRRVISKGAMSLPSFASRLTRR